jgi:hypothetical protein
LIRAAGSFFGHQLEPCGRLNFFKQWQLELGGAYLMKDEFLEYAQNKDNSTYLYLQIVYWLQDFVSLGAITWRYSSGFYL